MNMRGLVLMGSTLEAVQKEFTRETLSSVHGFGRGFWAGEAANVLGMG